MQLIIDDHLLNGVNLTHQEALVDFAVGLYTEKKVTLGRSAQIAGMSQAEWLKELGRRKVFVHYDLDDLEDDLNVIRKLT